MRDKMAVPAYILKIVDQRDQVDQRASNTRGADTV